MRLLWSALLFVALPASSCGILDANEQRRREKEDVALQLQLALGLARKADAVFIGRVVNIDEAQSLADVEVERVIKGKTERPVRLPANDVNGITVSCWASDMFRNSQLLAGRRYVFYVQGGTVLRAGWTTRVGGDVSLRSELRAVRRANGT